MLNFCGVFFAFKFLVNLRFKQSCARSKYGEDGYHLLRKYCDLLRKTAKISLDIDFLVKCKVYGVFPKFLRFKLYKRCLHNSNFYKSWQNKLLSKELSSKRKTLKSLTDLAAESEVQLARLFSTLDAFAIRQHARRSTEAFRKVTSLTHQRKLSNLGIHNEIRPIDPDKVVFNYSSFKLEPRIKFLLPLGLDFCLPIFKLDFYKFF